MKMHRGAAVFLVAVLLPQAVAQSTLGNVVGVVQDQTDAVVPAASVKIQNLDDNSVRTTVSGADGAFEFLNLKPGKYSIEIQKESFHDFVVSSLQLDSRQTARLKATLVLAAAGTSVEVMDQAALVDTESGTLSDVKKFNQVVQLPVNLPRRQ
jgi:hypothetical protein